MERLTYRNLPTDNTPYLKYGLDAKWKKMPRYDVIQKAIDKLADYEDAEEQGLRSRFHYKVGDIVYWINSQYTFNGVKRVDEEVIKEIIITEDVILIHMATTDIKYGVFGKTVFLTKEEAEAKLKEMEETK